MRVIFLTNNLNVKNGGGRFSRDLINSIQKENIEVKVLTTEVSNFKEESHLIYTSKIRLLFSLFKIRKIFKDYDIIHAIDGFPYSIIAVICSLGLSKKVIITAIGSGSIKYLYNKWAPILKWAYNRADVITAISSYTASEINRKVSNLNIKVIIPGIDYNSFYNQKIGKNIYGRYILSVGRIKERKGQYFSIKAFAKIAKCYPDLQYIIVGSNRGNYYKKLQALINELNLSDRIIFIEDISDKELVSLYKHTELFILLSQNINHDVEGFGLVFVEAAAFGSPVIGAWHSGAVDAILDGQNGWLVGSQDIDQAAHKMMLILDNEELKKNFSSRSIEFAKSLDWHIIVKEYIKIYNIVCVKKR